MGKLELSPYRRRGRHCYGREGGPGSRAVSEEDGVVLEIGFILRSYERY